MESSNSIEKSGKKLGLGEDQNFLDQENHIFINKLNYICKNYDQSFKDVSVMLASVYFWQNSLSLVTHRSKI